MSKTNAGAAASKKGGGKGKPLLGEEQLKVIMVGECGVGKSSLICKLVDNTFSDEPVTSLGMDFKLKTVSAEGKTLKLQIWVLSPLPLIFTYNHFILKIAHLSQLLLPISLSKDTAGQERFR
jgi:GTPase SAR1 family protein